LPEVDMVVTSTASPLPLLGKGLMERVLKQRRHKPMLLIDLAVPRDIEEEVGTLADAYLYTVDDLQGIVAENQSTRQQAARQAELLIGDEKEEFMAWYQGLPSLDLIRRYRQQAQQLQQDELQRAQQLLAQGQDPQQVMAELTHRLTNKLIHSPTEALRHAGETGDRESLAILSQSLGLDNP
jgi:glutamyl-tRNA reductase